MTKQIPATTQRLSAERSEKSGAALAVRTMAARFAAQVAPSGEGEADEDLGRAEPLLTPPEAAALLSVGVRTLERWRREGSGPAYLQLSRKTIRYRQTAILAFVYDSEKRNTAQ